MDKILALILKNTYSLTQYKHRLRILKDNLLKDFFGGGGENLAVTTHDSNWLKSLPSDFYQKFNKENVYEIFSNLEKMNLKQILTMYLTFEPDEITLNELGTRTRAIFGFADLLLDIKLNPNLIAGTALSWKGRMRDYSLKAKLEEKRAEITQGFRRFLR